MQVPILLPRDRLSVFQGVANTPTLLPPRTNKRAPASRSQSPTKRPTTDCETRFNVAKKSSANQTPLAEISSTQQARKRHNGKVQVFESGEPNPNGNTSLEM